MLSRTATYIVSVLSTILTSAAARESRTDARVLDYYRVSGLLVTVDGSGEIAETNGRICQTLDLVMNLKAKH